MYKNIIIFKTDDINEKQSRWKIKINVKSQEKNDLKLNENRIIIFLF